jgi:hypothetical protein
MSIVKYTATHSDSSTSDFLSLEDLIAYVTHPELHPDTLKAVVQKPVLNATSTNGGTVSKVSVTSQEKLPPFVTPNEVSPTK